LREQRPWIQRLDASELSQAEFAAQQGMGLSTLTRWVREARSRSPKEVPIPWQELKLPEGLSRSAWVAELILPGGCTIRLADSIARELVGKLLEGRGC
jgi:hypothetical protein